jgi:hypothetical protein
VVKQEGKDGEEQERAEDGAAYDPELEALELLGDGLELGAVVEQFGAVAVELGVDLGGDVVELLGLGCELGGEAGVGAGEAAEVGAEGTESFLVGPLGGRPRGEVTVGQGNEAGGVREKFEQLCEEAWPHSRSSSDADFSAAAV